MSQFTHALSLALITSILATISSDVAFATCYGNDPCYACKNCKYCKHCAKDGGTCGVCKGHSAHLVVHR